MIDFHSHILPNIDDGSRSVEETFTLIREAKEAGFEGVVSTSHYIEGYYESNVAERKTWINALSSKVANKHFNLYLGNEIYFTPNVLELLEEEKATTINNTNYVLFEFPLNSEPLNIYDFIYKLQQYRLIPVLAHPERYSFIQKNFKLVENLSDIGVLMQQNYGSIIGQYGKKAQYTAKKMLERDLVHFFGTDVHRANTIYTRIPEIVKVLQNLVGTEKFEKISSKNPQRALENKRIDY